jgi:hypothetical protein
MFYVENGLHDPSSASPMNGFDFFPEEGEISKTFLLGDRISKASPHKFWFSKILLKVLR